MSTYTYEKLTRQLRFYPHCPKELYDFVAETIVKRAPAAEDIPDALLQWAGHLLLHGRDALMPIPGIKRTVREALIASSVFALATTDLLDNRDEEIYRGLVFPFSPKDALLLLASTLGPKEMMEEEFASACLMSVFSNEDEAIAYTIDNFRP